MLSVVFVPKTYLEALCLNSVPVSHYNDAKQLTQKLRKQDLWEIRAYSQALSSIINSGKSATEIRSALGDGTKFEVKDEYSQYVLGAMDGFRNLQHSQPLSVDIGATADGTIVFLERPCTQTDLSYFECMFKAYGEAKGAEAMMSLNAW